MSVFIVFEAATGLVSKTCPSDVEETFDVSFYKDVTDDLGDDGLPSDRSNCLGR